MAESWLIEPEEFARIDRAVRQGESFEIQLVSDGSVKLTGVGREDQDDDVIEHLIFYPLRMNSLSFIYLSGAWNHGAVQYIFFVNDVPLAFDTPLGWSFIPPSHYAAGRLGAGFNASARMAMELLMQLVQKYPGGESG